MTAVETKTPTAVRKFPLSTLIAMVLGSMVGAGIFSLPRNFALATGVYGALVAWVLAGTGMLMLAFVFQTLAVRKPDLDAGVYHRDRVRGRAGADGGGDGLVRHVEAGAEPTCLFPSRAGHLRDRRGRGHCRDRRPGDRRDHYLRRTND